MTRLSSTFQQNACERLIIGLTMHLGQLSLASLRGRYISAISSTSFGWGKGGGKSLLSGGR